MGLSGLPVSTCTGRERRGPNRSPSRRWATTSTYEVPRQSRSWRCCGLRPAYTKIYSCVEYVHGIDWWLLRRMLAGKVGDLTPPERRILAVVASGGFWPEDRRYQCGYRDSSLCEACMLEVGTDVHRIHDCGAVSNDLIFAVAAGHLPRLPRDARKPALAPLLEMGLPPRPEPWQPIDGSYEDGHLTTDADQWVCGDGSGYHQQVLEARVATWAVVKKGRDANGKPTAAETFRGTVDGWYPTVPRGELSALNAHLRHAGPGSTYVGDCRHVLEGAEKGVPRPLTSSANINADLWRITRQLLDDHGGGVKVRKTKAHRSRTAALADADDALIHWEGNQLADEAAKSLAKAAAESLSTADAISRARSFSAQVIKRVAFGAEWAFRHWPAVDGRATRSRETDAGDDDAEDEGHIIKKRIDGTYECTACRKTARTAAGARRLMKEACGGDSYCKIDESHTLEHTRGITWCTRCGAYTTRWPRRLLKECDGRPRTAAQRTVLKRLRAGMAPLDSPHFSTAAKENIDGAERIASASAAVTGRYRRRPAERAEHDAMWRCVPCVDPLLGADLRLASSPGREPKETPPARVNTCTTSSQSVPVHTESGAHSAGDETKVGCQVPRRRIRGKSTPPPATPRPCARPLAPPSWTRWVNAEPHATPAVCDAVGQCGRLTKSKCAVCGRPRCVPCIRTGRQCNTGAPESMPGVRAFPIPPVIVHGCPWTPPALRMQPLADTPTFSRLRRRGAVMTMTVMTRIMIFVLAARLEMARVTVSRGLGLAMCLARPMLVLTMIMVAIVMRSSRSQAQPITIILVLASAARDRPLAPSNSIC